MASKFYAVVSGAGSGTGRSVALRFAKDYSVVVLARSASSHQPIVDEIRSSGGEAIGIAADATDSAAVASAFQTIAKEWPGKKLAAAVYNANAGFAIKPFLELSEEDIDTGLATST